MTNIVAVALLVVLVAVTLPFGTYVIDVWVILTGGLCKGGLKRWWSRPPRTIREELAAAVEVHTDALALARSWMSRLAKCGG